MLRTPTEESSSTGRHPKPTGFLGHVTRARNSIHERWIQGNCSFVELEELSKLYFEKVKNFVAACEQNLCDEDTSEEQKQDLLEWYQAQKLTISEFDCQLHKWLGENRPSFESASQVSCSFTNRSSTSSARARAAEAKAKAQAALDSQEALSKIKEQQFLLKLESEKHIRLMQEEQALREHKQFRLQQELEKQEVLKKRNEACLVQKELDIIDGIESQADNKSLYSKDVNKGAALFSSFEENSPIIKILSEQNKISQTLSAHHESLSLPRNEPFTFNGEDVTRFRAFQREFVSMIANRCKSNGDKYYYLQKYTSSQPLLLVQSCDTGNPDASYEPAMQLLEQQYGSKFSIEQAYIKKLENWPSIKNEDGKMIREFSIFLNSCKNALIGTGSVHRLDSATEIERIAMKLPFDLRKRYRSSFYSAVKKDCVSFEHLVNFVETQAEEMNMPVMSNIRDVNPIRHKNERFNNTNQTGKQVFATRASQSDQEKGNVVSCPTCGKNNHTLSDCFFFAKKPLADKKEFLRERGLCFACLEVGHRAGGCRRRLVCKRCKGKHPTCMHVLSSSSSEGENSGGSKKAEVLSASSKPTSNHNKLGDPIENLDQEASPHSLDGAKGVFAVQTQGVPSTMIESRRLSASVPVRVRIQGQKNLVLTYMGLDGFCSDSFISTHLMHKLGVKGAPVKFSMTTMEKQNSIKDSRMINNIEVFSLDERTRRVLPRVFAHSKWPFTIADSPRRSDVSSSEWLRDLPIEFIDEEIGLLIGTSTPELLRPYELVCGGPNDVYASRHLFGWALTGPSIMLQGKDINKNHCHLAKINKQQDIEEKFRQLYMHDYVDEDPEGPSLSIEDKKWHEIVSSSIQKLPNGHYQINLPFREEVVNMPCNFKQVHGRLQGLKRRFIRDPSYFLEYKKFIDEMLAQGYMEKVPEEDLRKEPGQVWFLTHFAVLHKQKKKLRIVFDCSLRNAGVSLNDKLLQGPDMINNLQGVLLRFRRDKIGFMADIEKMFLQVKVPPDQTNFLRLLWFPDGNLNSGPVQYRITSHLFGSISSPSIANFALKQTAKEDLCNYSKEARDAVEQDFYVDDIMKSVGSEAKAFNLLMELSNMLQHAGFNLTSMVCSSRKVLNMLPKDKLSKELKSLDLHNEDLPHDRALGVRWNVGEDTLGFRIQINEVKNTRRHILSTVSSVYDPLGIVSPVIVAGRIIFQETCRLKLDWDQELPEAISALWRSWIGEIDLLKNFVIPRCLMDPLYTVQEVQLHIFSDGSEKAYGATAYARFLSSEGIIHCSLIMAKGRLTPIGNTAMKTIPRIELCGARLAVLLKETLERERIFEFSRRIFWTDSMTVLQYLSNDSARYQRFVANKVAFIRSNTENCEWRFVPGHKNIADVVSRGMNAAQFVQQSNWISGPQFLWESELNWPDRPAKGEGSHDIELVKKKYILHVQLGEDKAADILMKSTFQWQKIVYRVATIQRLIQGLKNKVWQTGQFDLQDIVKAENAIYCYIQSIFYGEQICLVKDLKPLRKNDPLWKLYPFIDQFNVLRVGGRIERSSETEAAKHPIILPGKHHVVRALTLHQHREVGHMGRHYMMNVLRDRFWIIGVNRLVKDVLSHCIGCQKRNARPGQQLMSALPIERVAGGNPPFWHTGVDYFGNFMVTRGRSRSQEKRYGVVFTCLTSRAIHLEVAQSLDTSSFIAALRRFLAKRGRIRTINSDNGTNLVRACREMGDAIRSWNRNSLHQWCLQHGIEWKFHPPSASHFGGVWEREIRLVRNILLALLNKEPRKLDDESLNTFMCKAECILNNRPLTPLSNDPSDNRPLTPNHLLLLHSEGPLPPGDFSKEDSYCRQRWKRVQFISDKFWVRWRKEYLRLLQERQKWVSPRRSFKAGDMVLVVDYLLPRNQWGLGRVTEVREDENQHVRAVKLRISRNNSGRDLNVSSTQIERPVAKLVLLKSVDKEKKDLNA